MPTSPARFLVLLPHASSLERDRSGMGHPTIRIRYMARQVVAWRVVNILTGVAALLIVGCFLVTLIFNEAWGAAIFGLLVIVLTVLHMYTKMRVWKIDQ